MSPAISAYVQLIRTAESLHAEVSKHLLAEGLTASQFSTLKVLRLQGPVAQKEIANSLLKTGGNITLVVDNLEKSGLVERFGSEDDRRVTLVKLTRKGAELFDRIYPSHKERIEAAMSGLNLKKILELQEMLDALHPAIEKSLCEAETAQV